MKDERVPLKIVLQNFINHVENLEARLKENDDLYESEFQELKNISDSLKSQKYYACTEGEKSVNRRKNRYKDILPFDVSRVVLSEFPGVAGSDYINANYIRGASGSPAYIASQGPLPHTVADFWRMAVECEVQVIVMACNQTEAGKHKCEHYVPEVEDVEQMFGDVAVTLSQSRQVCPDFTVKKLTVRYTGASGNREERLVCQFHYSAWPDHGVPSSVVPLLHMIRMLRDTQASETLPVLVHCSAGCGRTGTICAIDYVWGLLKAGKLTPTFSLFDLVAEMRRQRIAMVQTKDQYMLVHRAVRQLFADQLRVIESHPYANVDGAGKVLTASATAAGDGDYEEICLAVEVPPPAQDRSGPSPPPRHRKSIPPRQRPRPPPLPHKRKAAQPEPELPPPLPAGGTGSEPEYRGSLDRAETGRRASVGRLRQVFEAGEPEPAAAAARPRLSRSRSSAALRCPPPGAPTNRPRTGSVSAPRDRQLVLYVPPAPPAGLNAPAPNARTRSPAPARPISRVKSPVQKARAPPPPDVPVHSQACAAPRARSPPQVRPVARTRTSPLPGGPGNSVPPPDVRIVVRTSSPSARAGAAAGRPAPPSDRRPVLPIKRSKSLKMPAAPLRAQRLGPAYLALENPPSRGGPAPPVRSAALPERSSAIFSERSAAGFGERNSALPERSSAVFSERNSAMLSERSSAGFGERSSAGLGERNSVMLSERSAGLAERSVPPPAAVRTAPPAARAAPRPLYVNVTPPPAQRSPPADSPPRYVNIDLLREYEEELVQRSRELGLNDTLTEETGLASPALVAHAISPHNGGGGGGGDAPGRGPRYGNVPPSPPPPLGEQPLPTANYPNCTPQVRQNLNRIETELQRNQRSGFYDTSGEPASVSVSVSSSAAAAVSRVPPSSLGWHARERRNSFRQAVQGGETSRGGQYERIWVGDDRRSPTVPAPPPEQKPPQQQPPPLSQQQQPQQPRVQPQSMPSAPAELENRVGGPPPPPPRPFVPPPARPPVSGSDPGRPAVVPVSSFIVQGVGGGGGGGGGGSSGDPGGAGSPLLVGNSLFWPEMLSRRGEPDPAAVTPPLHKTTANSVFYSDTPSPPGRSTSLSVSENSAFKPYLAEKASSPNFTAYKQADGDTPPWPGLPPGRTTTGMPNSASPPRGGPQPSGAARPSDAVDRRPVAPPRKRASSGALLSRLSVSQPQLVGPSHLFLADADLGLTCDGPERVSGADGDGADSDTDSLPPAVPEKTQAAYQVPTPVRDVLQQEQQQSLPLPLPPPLPPQQQQQPESLGGAVSSSGGGGGGLGRSLSLRPCDRAESAEPRPLNRALGRLQATASSLRSRLGGRTEPQERTPPPPPPAPPAPERTQQVNEHSRQAYI